MNQLGICLTAAILVLTTGREVSWEDLIAESWSRIGELELANPNIRANSLESGGCYVNLFSRSHHHNRHGRRGRALFRLDGNRKRLGLDARRQRWFDRRSRCPERRV